MTKWDNEYIKGQTYYTRTQIQDLEGQPVEDGGVRRADRPTLPPFYAT